MKLSKQIPIANPDLIYPGQVLSIPQLDTTVTAFENEVIRLVNKIRQENGLKSLSANWELSRVARYKSQDMVDNRYFAHNSPVYGTPFQMIKSFGISYRTAGENIAYGYKTPQAVVDGWMNSSGHRANILNKFLYPDRCGICGKWKLLDPNVYRIIDSGLEYKNTLCKVEFLTAL